MITDLNRERRCYEACVGIEEPEVIIKRFKKTNHRLVR
jgi:hypothetical protein